MTTKEARQLLSKLIESGNRLSTNEKYLKSKHPQIHAKILEHEFEGVVLGFKERVHLFLYDKNDANEGKCLNCKSLMSVKTVPKGWGDYCSKQCKDDYARLTGNAKVKRTKSIRYGDPNFNNISKHKETIRQKYGVDNVSDLEWVKDKKIQTTIKNYGVEYPNQSKTVKNKILRNVTEMWRERCQSFDISLVEYDSRRLVIKCNDCNCIEPVEMKSQLFQWRASRGHEPCVVKNPPENKGSSSEEIAIREWLSSQNIEYETNVRDVLKYDYELDLWIPKHKLAIEFNGLYWHSELFKDKHYHSRKSNLAAKEDVSIFHVWEDDWNERSDAIKSTILHRLNETKYRYYARKTVVSEIETKQAKRFLEKNHIQGYANSKHKFGLFYENELVAVMTFSNTRSGISRGSGLELIRFASLNYASVVGGASKLFKYAVQVLNPNRIQSFQDASYNNGNLYEVLGFQYKQTSSPNYWYVVGRSRKHRYSYAKHKLVERGFYNEKTEREIMSDLGYFRIWDCGNHLWVWEPMSKR